MAQLAPIQLCRPNSAKNLNLVLIIRFMLKEFSELGLLLGW